MSDYVAIVEIDDPDERAVSIEELQSWILSFLNSHMGPTLTVRRVEVRKVETT